MAEQSESSIQPPQAVDVSERNRKLEEALRPQVERIQRFLKDPSVQRSLAAASNFMNQFGIASKLGITDQEEYGYATMLVGNRFMRDKMGQAENKQARNAILKDNKFTSTVMGPVLRFLDKTHKEALQGENVYRESMEVAKNNMIATVGEERTATIESAMHMILTEALTQGKEQGNVRNYDESAVNLSEEKLTQWASNWKPKLETAQRKTPEPGMSGDGITVRASILPRSK